MTAASTLHLGERERVAVLRRVGWARSAVDRVGAVASGAGVDAGGSCFPLITPAAQAHAPMASCLPTASTARVECAICVHSQTVFFGTLDAFTVLQLSHCDGMIHSSQQFSSDPRLGVQGLEMMIMNTDTINYVMERLGTEANAADAEQVLDLAETLAAEQGDDDFDAINWLSNRTYDWTELLEAANGNVAALARVRAEAGLPVLS